MKNKLAFTLREKIARIFVLRHYLFLEAHRKIVCIFKQVMSAGKQQCIVFAANRGYCLFSLS